ncbi:hypothetical protein F443_09447 [Phytophthora nicotianae P1569]|uniref:Uncharacterized protein n=1 Tax=Phytophthora nicotianae P1569 TaxID=1317065 RepID=V9F5V7_PHYNI|nr:hypothetical protein F443_09447 [Phytophthora nicotianae P1569]
MSFVFVNGGSIYGLRSPSKPSTTTEGSSVLKIPGRPRSVGMYNHPAGFLGGYTVIPASGEAAAHARRAESFPLRVSTKW